MSRALGRRRLRLLGACAVATAIFGLAALWDTDALRQGGPGRITVRETPANPHPLHLAAFAKTTLDRTCSFDRWSDGRIPATSLSLRGPQWQKNNPCGPLSASSPQLPVASPVCWQLWKMHVDIGFDINGDNATMSGGAFSHLFLSNMPGASKHAYPPGDMMSPRLRKQVYRRHTCCAAW